MPSPKAPHLAETTIVIQPNGDGQAAVFGPALIFIHTIHQSTPQSPLPTQLVDLDPNSPHAKGLLQNFNVHTWWDNADVDRSVGDLAEDLTKLWERIADTDPSPDPVVRNLQATMDG